MRHMNRFEREHVDGIGDGLSIAVGILEKAGTYAEARARVTLALRRAREAKDRDNLRLIEEFIGQSSDPPASAR